jgi:hypothetical protein
LDCHAIAAELSALTGVVAHGLFLGMADVLIIAAEEGLQLKERKALQGGLVYPSAARSGPVESLHGTEVADPYRWLEEPQSERTTEWIAAQNKLTAEVLEECPGREKLKGRLTEMYNYPKTSSPFRRGENLYYFHNDGLQNQVSGNY